MQALGQGALQVLQRVQALHFAAAAVDELPEGVLLEQRLHVLEEEALAEQGQFWGIVDLWGQGDGVRPQPGSAPSPPDPPQGPRPGEAHPPWESFPKHISGWMGRSGRSQLCP